MRERETRGDRKRVLPDLSNSGMDADRVTDWQCGRVPR
jgi:hypothetical protein